jgi:hypothetical protein
MIANPIAMSEQFIPLLVPASLSKDPGFASLTLAAVTQAPAAQAFKSLIPASADQPHNSEACSKPTVTLQREGDAVSGIRIECGCGNVIELTCLQ